jgi:phage terminase large subunit-like protein
VTAVDDGLALLGGCVLEDGRLWGDVAEPWQWALAVWLLSPDSSPYRWESRPRGGSKTTDIAAIALVAMLTVLPAGSRLYAIAVDRDQGRLIAEAAAGFVARTPALASAVTVDSYKITARSGSVLEIMAADAASTYGLKPALVICDEFCQWPGTTNARGVWTAVLTAMGKVAGAKLLCTSTSGDPGHWSHKIYQTALKSKSWTVQDTLVR